MQDMTMVTTNNTFENLPDWVVQKWQDIADLLAETIGIPAALIMKAENEFMEVFISSHSEHNPYPVGSKEKWHGLYCETVIKTQHKLLVPNATKDKAWDKTPDIKRGMIAYLGFPLNFPDNKPFGTLCILDNKENEFTLLNEKLLRQFKNVIELDLSLLQTFDFKTSQLAANAGWEIAENKQAGAGLLKSEPQYRDLFDKANEGDLTGRKRNEGELTTLRRAIDSSGEAIFMTDRDGVFTFVNPGFTAMYGYAASEVVGKVTPRILKSGFFTGENCKTFWDTLLKGQEVKGELNNKRKDGTILNIEGTSNAIFDEDGNVIGFLGIHRDVTERKQAEDQLEETREKYRGLSEASFESIFISEKGICIEQNHTAEKIFGYTNNEAIGRFGTEWIVPEYRDIVLNHMLTSYEEPYEAVALRKNGTTFPCMLNAKMMHYKGRNVRVTSLNDITERKKAEAAIHQQLRFTKALNDIAGVIISTDDSSSIIENTTAILGETLGVDRCLVYDVNFFENQLTATSEWLNPGYPDIQPTKGVYPINVFSSGITEMRKTRHFLVSHFDEINPVLLPDHSDKILHGTMDIKSAIWYPFNFTTKGYYLLVLNETHHKREFNNEEIDFLNSVSKQVGIALEKIHLLEERHSAIEKIKASELRFRNMLQDVKNVAVQGYAPNGTTQYWNKASENLYGYTAREAIGSNLLDLIIPAEMREEVSGAINWMNETGQSIPSSELSLQRKDGSRVAVYSHHTLVQTPGCPPEFFCIDIDLTDRKQAEEKILELNRDLELRVKQRTSELEAANKELETFSYSVSHDLKAPLRHINGFIGLFLRNNTTKLTGEEYGYLNQVTSSANQMGQLIEALLSFSRLNQTELRKTTINSSEVVAQVIKFFDSEMTGRKITFYLEPLPEVKGDEELIRQVWTNLISNAIKYTMKKPEAVIEIGSTSNDNEITFYIKDNGAGFNMKYAEKLFGVFKRLHKTSDYEGVGIGLANVNRIVTRHGGHCRAEGEEDKGAIFYIGLPK
jgi:PAS domain S-box-containing protein